jgi:hypothetical protein
MGELLAITLPGPCQDPWKYVGISLPHSQTGSKSSGQNHSSTANLLTFSASFLTIPLPSLTFFRGVYFGSSSALPKMGFSPIYLRVLARSIYGTVFPTGLRLCLPPACIRKHNWTAYRMGSTIRLWRCRAHFKVTITMSISFRCNDCTRRRQ